MKDEKNLNVLDETLLDGQANEGETQTTALVMEEQKDGSHAWKKVVIGTGAGVLLGGTAAILASGTNPFSSPAVADTEADAAVTADESADATANAEASAATDGAQFAPMAHGVSDSMSFGAAYAAARAEVGTGGVFEWHGRLFNTFTAEEWDAMSSEERADFEGHVDWSAAHPYHAPHAQAAATPSVAPTEPVNSAHTVPTSEPVAAEEQAQQEIQVLGVYQDPASGANIVPFNVDGHDGLAVDVDGDEHLDYVFVDTNDDGVIDQVSVDINGDGSISEDEKLDISDQHVTFDQVLSPFVPSDQNIYSTSDTSADFDGMDLSEV